jgi:hypothetical protein
MPEAEGPGGLETGRGTSSPRQPSADAEGDGVAAQLPVEAGPCAAPEPPHGSADAGRPRGPEAGDGVVEGAGSPVREKSRGNRKKDAETGDGSRLTLFRSPDPGRAAALLGCSSRPEVGRPTGNAAARCAPGRRETREEATS